MKYEKIWAKTLAAGEKVEFEFSIGDRFRKSELAIWAFIGLITLVVGGLGIVVFLIALFKYGFYVKVANAYALTNKRMLIHRGWLSTHTTSVDYSKITDVHVIEPFLERLISHYGNLIVNTAGTTLHEVILKHVEMPYEIKKKLDELKDK